MLSMSYTQTDNASLSCSSFCFTQFLTSLTVVTNAPRCCQLLLPAFVPAVLILVFEECRGFSAVTYLSPVTCLGIFISSGLVVSLVVSDCCAQILTNAAMTPCGAV